MSELIEEYLSQLQEIEPVMVTIAAAASIFSIFNISFNLYKQHLTKAARKCKDLPGKEKALCMLRSKGQAKEIQLRALKAGMQKCMKSKDPEGCKKKFSAKMSKVGGEQGALTSRFQQLSQQKYAE